MVHNRTRHVFQVPQGREVGEIEGGKNGKWARGAGFIVVHAARGRHA
jgi:hypothetical protein